MKLYYFSYILATFVLSYLVLHMRYKGPMGNSFCMTTVMVQYTMAMIMDFVRATMGEWHV